MARNKEKPAPVIEPRCLTLQQAADYCALTRSGFSAWQRQGLVPGPIPGTNAQTKDGQLPAHLGGAAPGRATGAHATVQRLRSLADPKRAPKGSTTRKRRIPNRDEIPPATAALAFPGGSMGASGPRWKLHVAGWLLS